MHTGGGVNDLLPAYLVVALLAGLAMGRPAPARLGTWAEWGKAGRYATTVAGVLVIAQMAVLAAGVHPAAIPSGADRAAGLRLTAGLRTLGGTIAIPADPALALTAGLPEVEDQLATVDVLRASDPAAQASFTRSVATAVATQRFTVIITEVNGDLRGFPTDLSRYYTAVRRCRWPGFSQLRSAVVPGSSRSRCGSGSATDPAPRSRAR